MGTYSIHTDAAVDDKSAKAGIGFVINTEHHFVTQQSVSINSRSACDAEIIAVGSAAKWMCVNADVSSEDAIVFYVDNAQAVRYYRDVDDGIQTDRGAFIGNAVKYYKKLKEDARSVKVQKVWAHINSTSSGNKAADRLAKYAMRVPVRGEPECML